MFQAPRGTHDVLAADVMIRRHSVATAQRLAELAGYQPIEPPLFEAADLFVRSMGEATDVVEKEMYTFEDRGGERLALLPEGTASICRAYLEHGMANDPQPAKMYYTLPIFRYERPQAGRYRQHTQFGVEAIGVRDPALDAEVIELGWRITQELGLRSLTLLFNSIGDPADRQRYAAVLREYFAPHLEQLCSDCQRRFERAPLRLLDCKKRSCQPFQADAPANQRLLECGIARLRQRGQRAPGGAGDPSTRGSHPDAGSGLLHPHGVRDSPGAARDRKGR